MKRVLTTELLALAMLSIACSDRGRHNEPQPPTPPPADDKELLDASPRITGIEPEMHFADGGIVFEHDSGKGATRIVRLADGTEYLFVPGDSHGNGTYPHTTLTVNRQAIAISHAECVKEHDGTSWYMLTTAGGGKILIVDAKF